MRANDTNALWLDKVRPVTALIHQWEDSGGGLQNGEGGGRIPQRLRSIAPQNKQHQLAFLHRQDQKNTSRRFGFSWLRVHLVNMMSFTDRIQVTLTDWRPDTPNLHK